MTYDLAIIGSGFAGSLLAQIARQLGKTVVLIERRSHPRFAIGESSTPLANLLLEELATKYNLKNLRPFCKFGTWQQKYPEIPCGLKRGFTFYHHRGGQPWTVGDELLVGASPRDDIADTHWFRENFDAFLMQEARRLGVVYYEETEVKGVVEEANFISLACKSGSGEFQIKARFVLDASGPGGALSHLLGLERLSFSNFPRTSAVYSHFRNVPRWEDMHPQPSGIYPVDDAAVHHVFDGGWIWVLRFNNGITSAGAAFTRASVKKCIQSSARSLWESLLESFPSLQMQFAGAQPVQPFVHVPQLSYLVNKVAGNRWALLPSTAGFIDPLLSTGFPLTLLGIKRLAILIEGDFPADGLAAYAKATHEELEHAANLVGALYANFRDFEFFGTLTLLYFAAASFTETAYRLEKQGLAGDRFLLKANPDFAHGFAEICHLAKQPLTAVDRQAMLQKIKSTIEPFDVAGLAKLRRNNHFPVSLDDLYYSAWKVRATKAEIQNLAYKCGWLTSNPTLEPSHAQVSSVRSQETDSSQI